MFKIVPCTPRHPPAPPKKQLLSERLEYPDLCGVFATGGAPHSAIWYLAIYAGVSGTQILFQFSSTLLLKILSLAAARSMHNNMLKALLRSELSPLLCLMRLSERLLGETEPGDMLIGISEGLQ